MHEGPEPFALRRGMAFSDAVFNGSVEPVGMCSAFSKVGHMGESTHILAEFRRELVRTVAYAARMPSHVCSRLVAIQ